jgi:AcrR family transcriptional regulator
MRRREITDAVIRITVKGGLASATFREVAAEAGVSVRLVQYYFGTKDQLLLATQRRVAERSVARIQRFQAGAGPTATPRDRIRTIMRSFVPVDDESRDAMLVYIALFTASLLDPALKRKEAGEVPSSMQRAFAHQLRQAKLGPGVDPEREALILLMVVTGVSQAVLDGQITVEGAFATIDYALDRSAR